MDQEASLRGQIGAHALHARYDGREITAKARAAFFARFLNQVPRDIPEAERVRRAEHLLRAHMARLALRSVKARRKRQEASP